MQLNNTEIYMIQRFLENEIQCDAIKKVFNGVFEELWEDARKLAMKSENNIAVGELIRVCEFSQQQLKRAFIRLEQYRKVDDKNKKINKGL